MTKAKIGTAAAQRARQAQFHDALHCTLDCLVKDEIVSREEAAIYASCSDENLAMRLLSRTLSVMVDLQLKVVAAANMLTEADRFLEEIQAQAEGRLKLAA